MSYAEIGIIIEYVQWIANKMPTGHNDTIGKFTFRKHTVFIYFQKADIFLNQTNT